MFRIEGLPVGFRSDERLVAVARETDPVNWFAPLRVTVLTFAPTKLLAHIVGATLTWTCSITSSDTGATPVRSPTPPVVVCRPNEPLKCEPSIVMLLARLSCRQSCRCRHAAGLNRVMSVRRPEIVGSVARSSRHRRGGAVRPGRKSGCSPHDVHHLADGRGRARRRILRHAKRSVMLFCS